MTPGNYEARTACAGRDCACGEKNCGPTHSTWSGRITTGQVARSAGFLRGHLETALRPLTVVAAFADRRADRHTQQRLDRTANLRMAAHDGAERTTVPANPEHSVVFLDGRGAS